MKEINEILKNNGIRTTSYKKDGNIILVNTNKGMYIIKKNNIDKRVLEYLNNRGFKQYPDTIFDKSYTLI